MDKTIILLDDLTKSIHHTWINFFLLHNLLLIDIIKSIDWSSTIYPSKKNIFRVFSMDINEIKVVLLGQDPYHGSNQANGLAFSVNKNVIIPPSLCNIFKELKLEFIDRNYNFTSGDISRWFTEEKIFLLNSSLTVEHSKPGSHLKLWENFTDKVIEFINQKNDTCVFLLLGKYAQLKDKYIDKTRCVYGVHPSPLSASRGFFNSGIFRSIEEKIDKIDWSI
jgi:uracil-DNA glycosylase